MIFINLFLSVEVLVNQLRYRHRLGAITLTKVYTAFGEEARRRTKERCAERNQRTESYEKDQVIPNGKSHPD